MAWKGLYFANLLICFGVEGDFLTNFTICFCHGKVIVSCELRGFFFVASNAS
jgi:hypothetical protein